MQASVETGKEVEWTSEANYHFRLSALKDRLLEFYKQNEQFVVPSTRMQDVIRWVSEGLEDLSISRPVERLTWGIPVPDDDSQTIYVWLDALVNYITKAGYPWAPGQESALGWPADVQVIGKDIVRFHCIYWPAFLLALDLPPPKQILTHAHWTLGSRKMAKSTGNVVNPFYALDRYGVDVMRYYLAHDGGISDDADYSNDYIVERYKKGLQKGLGNLVSRITRPKGWNVRTAVEMSEKGELPKAVGLHVEQRERLDSLRDEVDKKFDQLNPGAALQLIMDSVYEVGVPTCHPHPKFRMHHRLTTFQTNKYLQHCAPWLLVKLAADNPNAETAHNTTARIHQTVYHSAEAIRIAGILLQPFMPTKSAQLLDMLGVDPGRRTYADAQFGCDKTYGEAKLPLGKCAWDALFPPLVIE